MTYRAWSAIEPDPRDISPLRGAQGLLADPAWLLARQWRFGELDGFDGGAPIQAEADHGVVRPGRVEVDGRPVEPPGGPGGPAVLAEPISSEVQAADRAALDLGRRLTTIAEALSAQDVAVARRWERMVVEAQPPAEAGPMARLGARRGSVDGRALIATLREEGDGVLSPALRAAARRLAPAAGIDTSVLPDGPREREIEAILAPSLRDEVIDLGRLAGAAERIVAGETRVATEEDRGVDPFDLPALTHRVTVGYGSGGAEGGDDTGEVTLEGPEPRPVWWNLVGVAPPASIEPEIERIVPGRLSYPGMPPTRHWTLVDAATDWLAVEAGPSELPRMIAACAMAQAAPHAVILPLTVPRVGALRVTEVRLRDGFGRISRHAPAEDGPDLWGTRVGAPGLLVDFPDRRPLTGATIEIAALAPEDLAEMAWLVERVVPGVVGRGETVIESVPLIDPPGDGEPPALELRRPPPSNWLPLLPDGRGDLVPRPIDDPDARMRLRGTLGPRLSRMPREELPSEGLAIERRWCLGRDPEGRAVAWIARLVVPHGERTASGLAFDRLVLPGDLP